MDDVMYELKIYIENTDLRMTYLDHILQHNNTMLVDKYPNSGFDLYTPETIHAEPGKVCTLDTGVSCAMYMYNAPCGFLMYPRSSICKTPLRLANSVGVIDSGYRGHLMGKFDLLNHHTNQYVVEKDTRLLQICTPTLQPFSVMLVDTKEELGTTSRGDGGFGSTGK
jgi:dUTP pyrophosphatase